MNALSGKTEPHKQPLFSSPLKNFHNYVPVEAEKSKFSQNSGYDDILSSIPVNI